MVLTRKAPNWGAGWYWPVPPIRTWEGNVYEPTVSDGMGSPRPGGREHRGVDIMYQRRSAGDRPEYPPRTHDGSPRFFAPHGVGVHAARSGKVWSAGWTPTGYTVVIDHGVPWATYYTHMDALAIPEHKRGVNTVTGAATPVNAGALLGTMGWSPKDGQQLRHLHFAPWYEGSGESAAVDPAQVMRTWGKLPVQNIPRATTIARKG
jgi:murein DD-endopeptidase MepM/ murein hydrolase activator NlpD